MINANEVYGRHDFATSYAGKIENNAYNHLYERPATEGLIPKDLKGLKALDLGCGPGVYVERLLERGAEVWGFDASDKMVAIAEKRNPQAKIFRYDFSQKLEMFSDQFFDFALSTLAFDYVKDWNSLFAEIARILKPGAICVFSASHPSADYYENRETLKLNYFDTEIKSEEWKSFGLSMESYRRPLSAMTDAILSNGFMIESLVEPQPIDECREKFPDIYETLIKNPGFICFRIVRKP